MIIVGYIEPFTLKKDNTMQLVNEVFVLLTNYTLFCFSDFVPKPDAKKAIGWMLVAITCLNIVVNIGIMIVESIIKAMRYLKLRLLRHEALKKLN